MTKTFRPGEGVVEDDIPVDQDSAAASIRKARDRMLNASDWTQLADAPISADKRAEWANYRQQLRDLPNQAGFPDKASFPTL